MKKNTTNLALLLLVFMLSIAACTPAPTPPTEALAPIEAATEESVALTEEVTETPFTILADPELTDAVTVLYQAYTSDESPVFVEADADLLVTAATGEWDIPGDIPVTFLPDAVLIPQSDSSDAAEFIDFAISIGGQQALIVAGLLPASITVTDQAGNTVEVAQPLQRVLSAYGSTTAMIYSVDGEDPLVAASYLGARDPAGAAAMEAIDPRFLELVGDSFFSQSDFNVEEASLG